jgi:hypothetical protein
MSNPTTKPVDHGVIKYVEPAPKPQRWMPRALAQLKIIEFGGMTHEQEAKRYGYYPMIALKTICLSGHIINPGEKLTVLGNTAHSLFSDDSAEFVSDGRREKELAVEKAAAELSMPIKLENEPAYTHPGFSEFPDAAPIKKRF